ncbi:hypothetical protein Bbelb_260870 [Branchiostoma belcheri]|nr:hypothetical protein Bbelb_260870 [Branchiostoma belcheri]
MVTERALRADFRRVHWWPAVCCRLRAAEPVPKLRHRATPCLRNRQATIPTAELRYHACNRPLSQPAVVPCSQTPAYPACRRAMPTPPDRQCATVPSTTQPELADRSLLPCMCLAFSVQPSPAAVAEPDTTPRVRDRFRRHGVARWRSLGTGSAARKRQHTAATNVGYGKETLWKRSALSGCLLGLSPRHCGLSPLFTTNKIQMWCAYDNFLSQGTGGHGGLSPNTLQHSPPLTVQVQLKAARCHSTS